MKWLLLLAIPCIGVAFSEGSVSYDGYKVYDITPNSEEQTEKVTAYEGNNDFDFWSLTTLPDRPITVMVAPNSQEVFEDTLATNGIEYSVLINNVEETVQAENLRQILSPRSSLGSVTFTQFMTHDEINAYLRSLEQRYPNIVTLVDFGRSYEGREMLLVQISSGGTNKPTIFVDAGIHAREWIAPPTALYIIHQLVENPENAALYANVDWAIIPVLNPDGYDYTQTDQRLWRKTRTPGNLCYGTDPNRNFDYGWMVAGASSNECSQTYAGPEAFSEVECRNLRDYLLQYNDTIKLYLSFHSYGNLLLYSWGYTNEYPDNADELQLLGDLVNDAIHSVAGTNYTVGSSTNVLYAAAGNSVDYAKGGAGIELAYTIELPRGGSSGFNPVASRILPIVEEMFEGIRAFHDYIENKFVNGTVNL